MNTGDLYVYSRPLGPDALRKSVQKVIKRFRIPTHTFASIDNNITVPPANENDGAYWFCAGDFHSTNGNGVLSSCVGSVDINYTKCLVHPNIQYPWSSADIKKTIHHQKVIKGRYAFHFVCHNITNRVLYSVYPGLSLSYFWNNNFIDITGYNFVVRSPLNVYGRLEPEWSQRRAFCGSKFGIDVDMASIPTRKTEIDRMTLNAVNGKSALAKELSSQLSRIDDRYLKQTEHLYYYFELGEITEETFDEEMSGANLELLLLTEQTVGIDYSASIHGITSEEFIETEEVSSERLRKIRRKVEEFLVDTDFIT